MKFNSWRRIVDKNMTIALDVEMRTGHSAQPPCRVAALAGFTLIELIVAMAVIGVVVVALYSAISSGFTSIRLARENLRATQILVEKMEAIRLYDWDEITSAGFIPKTFAASYDATTTNVTQGVIYTGQISISPVTPALMPVSYTNDLRLVTLQLNWTTGKLARSRVLSTYVCRTGLQNYKY